MWQIDAALIEPRREHDNRVVETALAKLVRTGVTSVHHNNGWPSFSSSSACTRPAGCPFAFTRHPQLPGWQRLRDYIADRGHGDQWLHWGAVKGYGVITAEAVLPVGLGRLAGGASGHGARR